MGSSANWVAAQNWATCFRLRCSLNNFVETLIVTIKDNAVVANSLNVGDYFSKSHKHVPRDIDSLLSSGHPDLDGLFIERNDYHEQSRKMVRSFDMTKDGFTLLAMGFTAKKAL